jgi:hypothetical protein
MTTEGERYRHYAAECLRIAQQVRDADHKARLLQMAEDWRLLAEAADKASGYSK